GPKCDESNFRKDVIEAIQDLNVTQLRWPGGNFASGYHWIDGVGPVEDRPSKMELAWDSVETNRFGTDEFLDFCDKVGVEPHICTNMGTGTAEEAQNWVEYCNGSEETYYADLRRENGRDSPYKVKYWGLGNEMYGEWQIGQLDAEDYAKKARKYAKLMKRIDPSIELIAVGWDEDPEWNKKVLSELEDYIDYISIHMYVGNEEDDYYSYMGTSKKIESRLDMLEGVIDSVMSEVPKDERVKIAFDEWNVWYRAFKEDLLEERYNLEDALVVSMFLNSFLRHCDYVKIANQAQLVNVIAPIMTKKGDLFLQTIYYPFSILANYNKGVGLDVHVDCDSYKLEDEKEVPYLDVSASYDEEEGSLTLNVINRHREDSISTVIENQKGEVGNKVDIHELSAKDIKSQNNFEEKDNVGVIERTFDDASNRFSYEFPPHSLTTLELEVSE
ncbi:hypothetical protein AKJ57_06195, partial [candidate division MSBL1 archaeon SCGC-AAA259A05]